MSQYHLAKQLSPLRPANFFAAALALCIVSCGGGGGGGGDKDDPSDNSDDPIENALNTLGVDTELTARKDAMGMDVPEGFTPFGSDWELSKTSELLIVGPTVHSADERFTLLDLTAEDGAAAEEVLHTLSDSEHDWITKEFGVPEPVRDVVCADVDDDGLEEIVIVYLADQELRARIIEDEEAGFAETDSPDRV